MTIHPFYKGLLIVDLNLKQIAICSNDSLGGFDVWIMGGDGMIYHPDPSRVGAEVEPGLLSRIQNRLLLLPASRPGIGHREDGPP